MFKRQDDKLLYFSTKVELKIGGTVYRPSICYKVPPLAKGSLEKYAEQGKITFYQSPVRFVNGTLAPSPTEQNTEVASIAERVEETKSSKRKGK